MSKNVHKTSQNVAKTHCSVISSIDIPEIVQKYIRTSCGRWEPCCEQTVQTRAFTYSISLHVSFEINDPKHIKNVTKRPKIVFSGPKLQEDVPK